jgi:hypothetical protein
MKGRWSRLGFLAMGRATKANRAWSRYSAGHGARITKSREGIDDAQDVAHVDFSISFAGHEVDALDRAHGEDTRETIQDANHVGYIHVAVMVPIAPCPRGI